MLTVDFDRLELAPGHRFLDIGAGAGRHSFEAAKRGADVVSLDYDGTELPGVRDLLTAMSMEGESPADSEFVVMRGDALRLPFPDASLDRIVVSEVLEHIADDNAALAEVHRVLKPGGVMAATVPAWFPEKVCWSLSAEYHAPLAAGGHVRVYTERLLSTRMAEAGLTVVGSDRTHALHSPYWWLRCLVGPTNDTDPLVRAYHRLLVWDMVSTPRVTRLAERMLARPLGKSLVVYGRRPRIERAAPGPRGL